MLIDWFTVVAQAVNFLILVWILKHFLYRPILEAIDRRDRDLAAAQASAAALAATAQAANDALDRQRREWDQSRQERIDRATGDAAAAAAALLAQARQDCAEQTLHARQELQERDARHWSEVERQCEEQIFAITRTALAALANVSLERGITEVFLQRLATLDAPARAAFAAALGRGGQPQVMSRFALDDEQRRSITQALTQLGAPAAAPRFTQAAQGIAGIEVMMEGCRVSWSLDGYLVQLRGRRDAEVSPLTRHQDPAPSAMPAAAPSRAAGQGPPPAPAPAPPAAPPAPIAAP